MTSNTDLAWLAGFIDGEGHFGGRETKGKVNAYYITCYLSISQKDPQLLYKVQRIVGAGSVNGPYLIQTRFTIYSYRYTGYKNLRLLLPQIWPYLGIPKKQQANAVLRKYKAGPTKGSTARVQN